VANDDVVSTALLLDAAQASSNSDSVLDGANDAGVSSPVLSHVKTARALLLDESPIFRTLAFLPDGPCSYDEDEA
jgi:hypothetical protein